MTFHNDVSNLFRTALALPRLLAFSVGILQGLPDHCCDLIVLVAVNAAQVVCFSRTSMLHTVMHLASLTTYVGTGLCTAHHQSKGLKRSEH